jgi:hypothetical protein
MKRVTQAGFDGGQIVPDPSKERLTSRQLDEYTEHRVRVVSWMQTIGKSPAEGEGDAPDTVSSRTDSTASTVGLGSEGRDTTRTAHDHADDWMRELADGDTTEENGASHRRQRRTSRYRRRTRRPRFPATLGPLRRTVGCRVLSLYRNTDGRGRRPVVPTSDQRPRSRRETRRQG